MQVDLRGYQSDTVADALAFFREPSRLRRRLYAAPTGTGKGTIQLALQADLGTAGAEAWIITPSLEIVRGFLERQGVEVASSAGKLAEQAAELRISTPIRFRNALMDGQAAPDVVIWAKKI